MNKNFFENLNPKSALIVGGITGFLVICAIGFFILLAVVLSGEASSKDGADTIVQAPTQNTQPVAQAPKSDKPVVELFVMSHCPYGLQSEKAFLPAWDLLKDKADMSVKFVNYAMHGLREIEEETRQLCIAQQGEDIYIKYLQCFTLADEPDKCLAQAGVNTTKITSCTDKIDSQYNIMDLYNDQSSWLSGRYPIFPVNDDLNKKYGVQGSPTLVINGAQISVARSPEAIKQAVCQAFNEAPALCDTVLSTAQASPSFGAGTTQGTATADCGA